ncbi:MAG: molybdopterin-dependent oxidoreductase [Thermoanaerobaculia bacterium]
MHFHEIDRRRFLLLAAAPLLAAQKAAIPHARESMLQMNGYAVNAETPLELLTDYVTPNELFFVRSHWIPRTPDPKKWKLTIDGEVNRSAQITLSELKKLPPAETTCVLQCAGNGRGLRGVIVSERALRLCRQRSASCFGAGLAIAARPLRRPDVPGKAPRSAH